jgi:hypothetical protein
VALLKNRKTMAKKMWIQEAVSKHPGKLRKRLGVKKGKKIPASKLKKAAKSKGSLGKEARLAETLKSLRKGKK